MKKIVFLTVLATIAFVNIQFAYSQGKKVAVFDPAGSMNTSLREIVREEISNIIVNLKSYTVLERQLINKVLEENKFQMGGLVDDGQVGEMGKRMGADYVFVTSITGLGSNNFYLSFKMIEVQTARIEWQKTGRTTKGENEVIDLTNKLVKEMFVEEVPKEPTGGKSKAEVVEESQPKVKSNPSDMLVTNGKKIYADGKKLNKNQVRNLYTTNFNKEALRFYEKGLSRRKGGNILLGTCIVPLFVGMGVGADIYKYDDNGNSIDDHLVEGAIIGGIVAIALGTTGIVLKKSAKKNIKKSVDSYNSSLSDKAYQTELKIGVTPKGGIGLVYNF